MVSDCTYSLHVAKVVRVAWSRMTNGAVYFIDIVVSAEAPKLYQICAPSVAQPESHGSLVVSLRDADADGFGLLIHLESRVGHGAEVVALGACDGLDGGGSVDGEWSLRIWLRSR